ncbi:hypothetical protein [Pseudonocardia sp.]|uniref:hypothetical protein n=1 Tax=Pseudonocardia sp. TaxID=60912 RepID=UPI002610B040|nr:hypothetical protein [Pseudonocardia sp.]
MTRFLRPSALLATAGDIWLVDDLQPVVARLDPADGRLLGLVDASEVPPPPVPRRPVAAADDTRLWMQLGDTLVCLDADGVRSTAEVPGLTLLAAGRPGAWLAEVRTPDIGDPQRGVAAPWPSPGRLVVVTADGALREVVLDRPPTGEAVADDDGLRLQVYLAAPTAIPHRGGYGLDYHETTVRLTWDALRHPRVAVGEHERVPLDAGPSQLYRLDVDEPGWRIGERTWRAGRIDAGPRHDPEVVAAGAEGDTEVLRVPLGRGVVLSGAPLHGWLWLLVARRDPGGGRAHEVVAVDPDTGAVTTVLGRDAVDITGHGWEPPPTPAPGAAAHARRWLEHLSDLDHHWRGTDGDPGSPLAAGLSGARAELVGSWPDQAVQVTFRHPWYPAGLLRRRLTLFDELGRPLDLEYCDIHLMEDLDTRDLPPPSEAVNGVLSV